jgi:hypothetical protein
MYMNIVIGLIAVVLLISIVSIIKKRHFTNTPAPVRPANPGPPVETAPWIDNTGGGRPDNRVDNTVDPVDTPPAM